MDLRKHLDSTIPLFSGLIIVLGLASTSASAVRKETVLYSFQGGTDGAVPSGGVVFDKAGNLYGATQDGGGSGCAPISPCGTAFQLSPPTKQGDPWTETQLHIFTGVTKTAKDGADPSSGLVIDAAGNLYGTTAYGGNGGCVLAGNHGGCGTVYELTPPKKTGGKWGYKIIYSFRGGKDGDVANGDLVFDAAGNLYGATLFGGGFGSCDAPFYENCGTVFELSPPQTKGGKWTEKVLYSFKSGKDGANPNGGLVFDKKGAIYGTTVFGGSSDQICKTVSGTGCGTVFHLKPAIGSGSDWSESVLYRFKPGTDGAAPNGGLLIDSVHHLFGTTLAGGSSQSGIVFALSEVKGKNQWVETVLHTFQDGADAANPSSGLTLDASGNLYGTACCGGVLGGGAVYQLKPPQNHGVWIYSARYFFNGAPDGSYPSGKLVFDDVGNLYGTTLQSGDTGQACGRQGCGTVFVVSP
jgi:hypothetical protein